MSLDVDFLNSLTLYYLFKMIPGHFCDFSWKLKLWFHIETTFDIVDRIINGKFVQKMKTGNIIS